MESLLGILLKLDSIPHSPEHKGELIEFMNRSIKDIDLADLELIADSDIHPDFPDMFSILLEMRSVQDVIKNGQWQTAEQHCHKFIEKAQALGIFAYQLFGRERLSLVYRRLNRHRDAMAVSAGIIAVAYDPKLPQIIEKDRLRFEGMLGPMAFLADTVAPSIQPIVHNAYKNLVNSVLDVSEFSPAQIEPLIDDWQKYIESIDHPEWEHTIRLARSDMLALAGRFEESMQEAMRALELAENDPDGPGYVTSQYVLDVGNRLLDAGNYGESILYFTRLVQSATRDFLHQGYRGLANAYLQIGDLDRAEETATLSLEVAEQIGDKRVLADTTRVLSQILGKQRQHAKAIQLAAKDIQLMRSQPYPFMSLKNCADVRISEARSLRDSHGALTTSHFVSRRANSARRWLRKAELCAIQLDRVFETDYRQKQVAELVSAAQSLPNIQVTKVGL